MTDIFFQLLDAIGAVEPDAKKKAAPYQDDVTRAPESEDPDADAVDDDGDDGNSGPMLSGIKGTVRKVCFFYNIHAI